MEATAVMQLVTVVVAALGIVWHQHHSINQLRTDTREDLEHHRAETREDLKQHRAETREGLRALREDHNRLSDAITQNGQRLARIEGHLGIGMPPAIDESAATDSP